MVWTSCRAHRRKLGASCPRPDGQRLGSAGASGVASASQAWHGMSRTAESQRSPLQTHNPRRERTLLAAVLAPACISETMPARRQLPGPPFLSAAGTSRPAARPCSRPLSRWGATGSSLCASQPGRVPATALGHSQEGRFIAGRQYCERPASPGSARGWSWDWTRPGIMLRSQQPSAIQPPRTRPRVGNGRWSRFAGAASQKQAACVVALCWSSSSTGAPPRVDPGRSRVTPSQDAGAAGRLFHPGEQGLRVPCNPCERLDAYVSRYGLDETLRMGVCWPPGLGPTQMTPAARQVEKRTLHAPGERFRATGPFAGSLALTLLLPCPALPPALLLLLLLVLLLLRRRRRRRAHTHPVTHPYGGSLSYVPIPRLDWLRLSTGVILRPSLIIAERCVAARAGPF